MDKIRIPWDKYEVALLIEAYLKIQEKKRSRTEILLELSNNLRQKAINEGKTIDKYFRNYNGMCFMINSIATTFHPQKYSIHGSNLFTNMVNLYNIDINQFNIILNKAHDLVNNIQEFKYVLHNKYGFGEIIDEGQGIWNIKFNNYPEVKHIQIGHQSIKFISKEEFFKHYHQLTQNKNIESLKKIKNKQLNNNIKEVELKVDFTDYKIIIEEFFDNGFLFKSPLQRRKFNRLYLEKFNKELNDNDDLYFNKIKQVGFIHENKVYPISMISDSLREEIKDFILQHLNAQYPIIYYDKLYQNFSDKLNPIFDKNMFREYLKIAFKNDFKFEEEFIILSGIDLDIKQCLINVFKKNNRPLDKEFIYQELPNMTIDAIDGLLTDKDFIVNYRGKSYFYKDVFVISDNELEKISDFIKNKINEQDCLSGAELYNYIQQTFPNIIESNPEVTDLGVRNIIKRHLDYRFSFKGDVISNLNSIIDVKSLYSNFSKQREFFTFQDLEEYKNKIHKTYIDYDAIFQNAIRINRNEFVKKDSVIFNIELIDNAIMKYCNNDYVSFCDIINFIEFPTIQYAWNNYILESYLFSVSKKFKLIHATFNAEKPVGGIVKQTSSINCFDDLLVNVIKDNQLFNIEKAFEYLLENNYILTRKISNLDILIDRAKQEV